MSKSNSVRGAEIEAAEALSSLDARVLHISTYLDEVVILKYD
jgi:hypothetical protein